VELPQKRRTCDQVFDEFLLACDSRVAKKDLAFVTARGYAKLLAQIWRPEIGPRVFEEIRPTFTRSNKRWKEDPPQAAQFPMFVLQFPL
jgi:hypothetical protein